MRRGKMKPGKSYETISVRVCPTESLYKEEGNALLKFVGDTSTDVLKPWLEQLHYDSEAERVAAAAATLPRNVIKPWRVQPRYL